MATTETEPQTSSAAESWATPVADWARLGQHRITLPSGARVVIQIPDMLAMFQHDSVPERLKYAALYQLGKEMVELTGMEMPDLGVPAAGPDTEGKLTWDFAREVAELQEHIAHDMIVAPALTLDDFRGLPAADRDMLVEIAQRERDTDALGVRLGVSPLDPWEAFREAHGCSSEPPCTACAQLQQDFSSISALPV